MNKPLIILDCIENNYHYSGLIYTWNGYIEKSQKFSILKYVENNSDHLKEKFLTFIYDIGEHVFKEKKIIDHLKINNEFSLWWMSLIHEKNPWKSPMIIDCIKVMAIEKIVSEMMPTKIILTVENINLARVLMNFCKKMRIEFQWTTKKHKYLNFIKHNDSFTSYYNKLMGFLYLSYYFGSRWKLSKMIDDTSPIDSSVLFSSYFFNLDRIKIKKGEYYSNQWGDLPRLLNSLGYKTTHIENYVKSPDVKKTSYAKKLICLFNAESKLKRHFFLDQYLSLKSYFSILRKYIMIIMTLINYKDIREAFNVKNTNINLWPLMKDDWFSSFSGKTTMLNLILINLFNNHCRNMTHQKLGFYLCENMGWERALIYAWKKYGHGILIAVPHSTIRYWDLRYFQDKRTTKSLTKFFQPTPDYYALNGNQAYNYFLENESSNKILLKVEALRYQFLSKFSENLLYKPIKVSRQNNGKKEVLILGDFTEKQTKCMLTEIQTLNEKFDFRANYTLKPHPVSSIKVSQYPSLNLSITHELLESIICDFDIVFASNTTSASLECFLMGVKTIIFLDGDNLNFSPLRNVDGVSFVCNAKELYKELGLNDLYSKESRIEKFFWVDKKMSRWKKIIDSFLKN